MSDRFDFEVSVGNGGDASSSANGGVVTIRDVDSGGNIGNVVEAGDSTGNVLVDAGSSSNVTTIGVSADGGVSVSDASGGDYNIVFVS